MGVLTIIGSILFVGCTSLLAGAQSVNKNKICKTSSCILPNCRCSHAPTPKNFTFHQVPQMVIFTFDDAVRPSDYKFYTKLFSPDRRNPNGCPISMTMFVQHLYTNYSLVNKLYQMGMEVAVHSVTHKTPTAYWRDIDEKNLKMEILDQKANLNKYAKIPNSSIIGWRSPFLQPSGDLQYDILKRNGFKYDSSLTVRRNSENKNIWPFTLDFGWRFPCDVKPCPENRYAGFWEFPIVPLVAYQEKQLRDFIYVDSYRPVNSTQAYNYLMSNFLAHYKHKRQPFVLNMHSSWFYTYTHNLYGMDLFIRRLLTYDDVYIVNMQKALEWMKNPQSVRHVNQFKPWNCKNPKARKKSQITPTMYVPTTTKSTTTKLTFRPIPKCIPNVNCRRPNCRCDVAFDTNVLSKSEIPQIVLFTFDDAVNIRNYKFYKTLFNTNKTNPNGCPISMTLFLQHRYTNYKFVKEFYSKGMEIAVHSVTHKTPNKWWITANRSDLLKEVIEMRNNIEKFAGIPKHHVTGWRSPFLHASGDTLFTLLRDYKFVYDSTLSNSRDKFKTKQVWPFTLDYGWQRDCPVLSCPKKAYRGLWEFPISSLINPNTLYPCSYVDSCRPSSLNESYNYLYNNFLSYYHGSKAPFMLNMHASWFELENGQNLEAMDKFITKLLTFNDVYLVTIQKAIEWLKNPKPLSMIKYFKRWSCDWRPSPLPVLVSTKPKTKPSSFSLSSSPSKISSEHNNETPSTNIITKITNKTSGNSKTTGGLQWYVIALIVFAIIAIVVIIALILCSSSMRKHLSPSNTQLEKLALDLKQKRDNAIDKPLFEVTPQYLDMATLKAHNEIKPAIDPYERIIEEGLSTTKPKTKLLTENGKAQKGSLLDLNASKVQNSSSKPSSNSNVNRPSRPQSKLTNRSLPKLPNATTSKSKRKSKSSNRYKGDLETVKKSVMGELDAFSQGHSTPADNVYYSINDDWLNLNLQTNNQDNLR